jgi:hypothetical protein
LRKRDGSPFKAFVADLPIQPSGSGGMIVGVSTTAAKRREASRDISPLFESLRAQLG